MTGDAVNLAARFEQAAEPGEILIGAQTERLVGGLVRAEPVTPLRLKGKAEAVPAFRLIEVLPMCPRSPLRSMRPSSAAWRSWPRFEPRPHRRWRSVYLQLCHDRRPAGIGKSRIVREFLAGERGRARL